VTVIDMNNYRQVVCGDCLRVVARRELPAHVRDCREERSRRVHPSNWTPGA
jgi:hypothetical protein